jgi:multicomponent Na+:H+ antiporter subunit D
VSPLLILPIALPLATAAVTVGLVRWPVVRRTAGILALGGTLASCVLLLIAVSDGTVLVGHVGSVTFPLGITLVADTFSAILLTISAIVLLAVFLFAVGSPKTDETRAFFHSLYLILAAGVSACFLTGDLFNLFVSFEVTLTASYVLITFGGSKLQIRHGMTYVVISLFASTLFITAVGLVYAATGTVNMADLATKLTEIDPGLRSALGLLFLVVFGIKAAIFPLFFWLPDSYPVAVAPVTAVFAGILTKIGVYAIIRSQTLLFGDGAPSSLLLTVAALTMVTGVFGAITQDDVKRILSFHIISQIGYMIFGLGLYTLAGLAAAVYYIVHNIVVKTSLLLVGGLIEELTGTGALRRLGGLLHTSPLLAALFLLPALSIAGIPPFSGFVGKLALIDAGFAIGEHATVAVAIAVSALTLFSMTKIWAGVFWGKADEPPPHPAGLEASPPRFPRLMTGSTGFLVVVSLAIAFGAAPLYELGEVAASGLIDPTAYVAAVRMP